MASPVDFDMPTLSSPDHASAPGFPQLALFTVLCLVLGLPAQQVCWNVIFGHPSVNNSAMKMFFMKVTLVLQAGLLGAVTNDMVFQLAVDPKALPKLPALWITPVTCICAVILKCSGSTKVMSHHLFMSLMVGVVPAIVLFQTGRPAWFEQNELNNIAAIYIVGLLAIFWEDIKEAVAHYQLKVPAGFLHPSVDPTWKGENVKQGDSDTSIATNSSGRSQTTIASNESLVANTELPAANSDQSLA